MGQTDYYTFPDGIGVTWYDGTHFPGETHRWEGEAGSFNNPSIDARLG